MFWVKNDELLDGRWRRINWKQFLWFWYNDIVVCISKKYPPESKDRGYAHSGERREL